MDGGSTPPISTKKLAIPPAFLFRCRCRYDWGAFPPDPLRRIAPNCPGNLLPAVKLARGKGRSDKREELLVGGEPADRAEVGGAEPARRFVLEQMERVRGEAAP